MWKRLGEERTEALGHSACGVLVCHGRALLFLSGWGQTFPALMDENVSARSAQAIQLSADAVFTSVFLPHLRLFNIRERGGRQFREEGLR